MLITLMSVWFSELILEMWRRAADWRDDRTTKASAIKAELRWSCACNPWWSMEVTQFLKIQASPALSEALSHATSVKHKVRSKLSISFLLWLNLRLTDCCLTISFCLNPFSCCLQHSRCHICLGLNLLLENQMVPCSPKETNTFMIECSKGLHTVVDKKLPKIH